MSDPSPARLLTCSDAEYHADPVSPSLSASTAVTMLTESDWHAWAGHPRLGNLGREPTDDMERGTVLHALVLHQPLDGVIAVVEADDFKTKLAKEARDEARRSRRIPILARKLASLRGFASRVRAEIERLGIPLDGAAEQAVTWTEHAADGTAVVCRGKFDHWTAREILDLKFAASAHPEQIARNFVDNGYDVQHAAYTSAFRKLRPEMAGRERMRFLFCEESHGHAIVTPIAPDGELREIGARRWQRAVDRWARCIATGTWSKYADETQEISAPVWALSKEGL